MKEYRLLIPVGGQLPQAQKLIEVRDKDNGGAAVMVMVTSIKSITWGTKGNTDTVVGVFVDFYGVAWPPILLSPELMKKLKRKHVVAYDRHTGIRRTCFYSDDVLEEVPEGSCPVCAAREKEKQETPT